jgi:magnesium-transporting ATPase (P-type)
LLGLLSLEDPPKPGVDEAVLKCKEAGVRVAMITGDHPLTAEMMARKVGRALSARRDVVMLLKPRQLARYCRTLAIWWIRSRSILGVRVRLTPWSRVLHGR